jgi:eukaryotic-like serine/threonine-protein kinase
MKLPAAVRTFLRELKRRHVYRVGVVYVMFGYLALEVVGNLTEPFAFSDQLRVILLVAWVAGLPVALGFAWAYEVTAGEVVFDEGGPLGDFIGTGRGRRLALAFSVALVGLAGGFTAWYGWLRPSLDSPAVASPPRLDPKRIAVLYFDDHSPAQDLEYLAHGLTEGLIHELSQVPQLEVVSRTGVKPFRGSQVPTDSIAQVLRSGSLVEGSITGSEDRVRLTVQLIDGPSDTHLESLSFERSRDDLFSLQTALAREVADALRRRIGTEIRLREDREAAPDEEAWALVLRSSRLWEDFEAIWRRDAEAGARILQQIDSMLAVAVARDGEWPQPRVGRARVSVSLAFLQAPIPGQMERAAAAEGLRHLEGVLDRDDADAEAYLLRGLLRAGLSSTSAPAEATALRDDAGTDLQRAVDLDPQSAPAWIALSEWLLDEGRFAEAQRAAVRAQEADAFLLLPERVLFQYYYSVLQTGPVDEAREACDEGHARFPANPDFVTCQLFVLAFPDARPDLDRAWTLLDSLLEVSSERGQEEMRSFGLVQVAKVLAHAAMPDSAEAVLSRAVGPDGTPDHLLYDEAHLRVLMGEPDRAIDLLERYLAVDPDTAFVAEDWWFETLHGEPRFRSLIGR